MHCNLPVSTAPADRINQSTRSSVAKNYGIASLCCVVSKNQRTYKTCRSRATQMCIETQREERVVRGERERERERWTKWDRSEVVCRPPCAVSSCQSLLAPFLPPTGPTLPRSSPVRAKHRLQSQDGIDNERTNRTRSKRYRGCSSCPRIGFQTQKPKPNYVLLACFKKIKIVWAGLRWHVINSGSFLNYLNFCWKTHEDPFGLSRI